VKPFRRLIAEFRRFEPELDAARPKWLKGRRAARKRPRNSFLGSVGSEFAMARRCAVTGKGVQVGHNVSHANNKTKRRYLPNLQRTSVLSDVLGSVRLRITTAAIRTIEHKGGIDAFVRDTPDRKLSPEIRRLKRRIAAAAARKSG
jgi:large subunit ribosomal protein L28